ncbi:polymer-forming cytoskeletal protein [Paenibacillus sp. TRM 82003]|nr:polymer-forming cytoskeletal protein [Paenibacillus sp. TRM 82003]
MFKAKRIDVSATDTLIGEGSVFEGKIKSEASLRVEGQMIGDIECGGDVTIGEGGKAKSNITARNVVIAGTVHGNVTTRGTLTLTGTGKLFGNTSAPSLVISEGAVFQGMSRMETKGAEAEAETKPTAQGPSSPYAPVNSSVS